MPRCPGLAWGVSRGFPATVNYRKLSLCCIPFSSSIRGQVNPIRSAFCSSALRQINATWGGCGCSRGLTYGLPSSPTICSCHWNRGGENNAHQCYCENTDRVALQRRLPEDDQVISALGRVARIRGPGWL